MRLLEEREQKIDALRIAIEEGKQSGESDRTLREIAQQAKLELENEL